MDAPTLRRWSHAAPPGEEALLQMIEAEGLHPAWWENLPNERYAVHQHAYHKVLFCQRGSITFILPNTGDRLELRPGDRLDLPPNTPHSAVVGPGGVRCVEAPRWR